MSIIPKIGDRIEVLRVKLGNKTVAELEKGDLPGDERLLGNATISGWMDKPITWASDKLEKFLTHYRIDRTWWKTGEGKVFITSVQEPGDNKKNGMTTKETFYQDLIENNEEYSLLPRAVLKDYKIVPDKIIDVIISSNENEKKALRESKDMEIESLMKKYELIIEGLENKTKRLEGEKEDLVKEKNALLQEIAGLRRQIPANKQ
jgi:hypothetical protein